MDDLLVLGGRLCPGYIGSCYGTNRVRGCQPSEGVFVFGRRLHAGVGVGLFEPVFEEETETNQMQANRLDALAVSATGVLDGIGIYRQAVDAPVEWVTVLTGKDSTVDGPASRRRFHLAVGGTIDVRVCSPAAEARYGFHTHEDIRYRKDVSTGSTL